MSITTLPLLLALGSAPSHAAEQPEAVVLIVLDTLRADVLSPYGAPKGQTPALQRLADAGVTFSRAQSAAPWTRPGVGSILTGAYPTRLGLIEKPLADGQSVGPRERRPQLNAHVPEAFTTVGEALSDAGYQTAAFVNQQALRDKGYDQGMGEYWYPIEGGTMHRFVAGDTNPGHDNWQDKHEQYAADVAVVGQWSSWLSAHEGERTTSWVHLLTPHSPYLPPAGFEPAVDGKPSQRDLYIGDVRATDALVGRVLDHLDATVGLDKALVIVTSDHGEEFYEHGGTGHGHSLYTEQLSVPLLMAGPGLPEGRTIAQPVRTIDILPTVQDLLGRPITEADGVSLLPAVAGKDLGLDVYAEAMLYGNTKRSIQRGDRKLIVDSTAGTQQLFAVEADRREKSDLAAKESPQLVALRSQLVAVRARLLQACGTCGEGDGSEQDAENMEALRALGYME